jgi:predicted PurR-regulated permease PerM
MNDPRDATPGLDDVPETAERRHTEPAVPVWVIGAAAVGWRVLVLVALAAVAGQIAVALSTAVLAVLVGAFVAATFSPLVSVLRARAGWSGRMASGVASVLALGAVLGAAILVILAFLPYVDELVGLARVGATGVADELAQLGLPSPVVDAIGRSITDAQAAAPGIVQSLLGSVGTLVAILVLGGFLAFYLMADADRALSAATADLEADAATEVRRRAAWATRQVGAYLRANLLTAVSNAVSQGAYLALLGVPLAGPLAVFVFVAAFVPYLGAILSAGVLALVTSATVGPQGALVLLVLIGATAIVQRRVVDRLVYDRAIRVHPALVLLVAPAGAALFGIAGLLLAVPVAAAVLAFAPAVAEVVGADEPRSRASVVPPWLDRVAQVGWRVLVLVVALAVAAQVVVAPFLTAPVVVALVVACAAKPGSDALQRRGLDRTASALLITVVSAAIVSAILGITLVSLATQLPAILDQARGGAQRLLPGEVLAEVVGSIQPDLAALSRALITNVVTVVAALVTAAILTFFFLRDGPRWWSALLDRVPDARRAELGRSGARAASILNGATLGTGLVSAIAGVLQFLMLAVLGLPLAVPIGVLTFFSGFIPYIGNFIVTGVVVLLAVAVGGPTTILAVGILTVVNNILIGNVVAPLVLGRTVNIHPAIVLLAAPLGASIGGLIGMFLIVPTIAVLQVTWRSIAALFMPLPVRTRGERPSKAARRGSG